MKITTHFASAYLALICFVALSTQVQAQNSSLQFDSLYSNILKEHRSFKVIVPEKFKAGSTDRFDVLYVLDGEWNTPLAIDLYKFLEYGKFIPGNMIIVNVPNLYKNGVNMRDRDFTPTSPKRGSMSGGTTPGGADNFLMFLKTELIPFVNAKYPTNTENNILYGTSLGGLFAVYAYLQESTPFKSFVTVEPSLWWDGEYISKIAPEKLEKKKGIKNTLWISSRDGKDKAQMGITGFDSLLALKAPADLQWKVQAYPDETHFSVIWKGVYDGMRFTYVTPKPDGTIVNRAEAIGK